MQKRSRLSGKVQVRDRLMKFNGFYLNLWKPAQAGFVCVAAVSTAQLTRLGEDKIATVEGTRLNPTQNS